MRAVRCGQPATRIFGGDDLVIDFAKLPNPAKERPVLVLRNLSGNALQTLGYAFNVKAELSYNDVSTLTFDIPSMVDGQPVPNYDEVIGMRQVDLMGNDGVACASFMLIDPQEKDDGVRKVKSCKGYSMEYELAKKDIFIDAGTYNFHNPFSDYQAPTIKSLVMEIATPLGWSMGTIDDVLIGRYRTFDEQKVKLYDFIKSSVQTKYGCIFEFDTVNKVINVVDAAAELTMNRVFLSPDRLIKEIDINENSNNIVTALDVSGADGVTIRSVNPTGTNVIYNLDYFMNEQNFPGGNSPEPNPGIITTWTAWQQACEDAQQGYYDTTIQYNMKLLQVLMEEAKLADMNAQLLAKENVQAVIIEGIAQHLKTKSDLTAINGEITALKTQIAGQQAQVDALQAEADALHAALETINSDLAFETWFPSTQDQAALKRYFFEDSLQDGSFVAETAKTYVPLSLNSAVTSKALSLTDGIVTSATNATTHRTVYSCKDGKLVFDNLTCYVVSATCDKAQDNSVVFTAYVRDGLLGTAEFSSATITIVGNTGGITSSDSGLSFTITSGDFYFTEDTTEYELHQIEYELYEYGKEVLKQKASPSYNFTVNSGNFLVMDDYVAFQNQLKLGQGVYLKLADDGEIFKPYVISVTLDYEDLDDFSIKFSSSYTSFDKSFDLTDLLSQSISMGKTLSSKGNAYELFVASGASTSVRDFMTSALDIATNAVMSTGNQAITFDDSGLRIRKWADDGQTYYEDEQIWMVDNVIAFTNDGWQSSEMAIGKIFDDNLKSYIKTEDTSQVQGKTYYTDENGTVWNGTTPPWSTDLYEQSYGYVETNDATPDANKTYYYRDNDEWVTWNRSSPAWNSGTQFYEKVLGGAVYGVCAPYIVGTLLAGNNLVIESAKREGGSSVFRVDGEGARLYNASFTVNNGTSEIMLDPELGFGLGSAANGGIVEVVNNVRQWKEANTKLWIDTAGNAHFKGNLEAATGTFNGTFSGELHVGPIANTDPIRYHFNVDQNGYITLMNNNGTIQMAADASSGNLSFKGALQVGPRTYNGSTFYRFEVDSNGTITLKNNRGVQTFYVDSTTGNAVFGGSLDAVDGTFEGELNMSGGATVNGTISAEHIKLSGLLSVYKSASGNTVGGYLGYSSSFYSGSGIGVKSPLENSQLLCSDSVGAVLGYIEPEEGFGYTGIQAYENTLILNTYGESGNWLHHDHKVELRGYNGYAEFVPNSFNGTSPIVDLGSSSNKWRNTYCSSGTWTGSDRNSKEEINYSTEEFLQIFEKLRPCSYKYKDGSSGRTHLGFIAQDVEQALLESGFTTSDYACIAIAPRKDDEGVDYFLRYEEFIALNTMKIKKLEERIIALEAQLS